MSYTKGVNKMDEIRTADKKTKNVSFLNRCFIVGLSPYIKAKDCIPDNIA